MCWRIYCIGLRGPLSKWPYRAHSLSFFLPRHLSLGRASLDLHQCRTENTGACISNCKFIVINAKRRMDEHYFAAFGFTACPGRDRLSVPSRTVSSRCTWKVRPVRHRRPWLYLRGSLSRRLVPHHRRIVLQHRLWHWEQSLWFSLKNVVCFASFRPIIRNKTILETRQDLVRNRNEDLFLWTFNSRVLPAISTMHA